MSIASPTIRETQRVIALVDLENILFSLPTLTEVGFQIEEAFERFSAWLDQIGETKAIFVFGSERSIFSRRVDFQKLKWFPILCPKIRAKKRHRFDTSRAEERDTSDENIIRLWGVLNDMPDWEVLCIASGDIDFVPMARETLRRGKKIAIAAIEGIPLSKELQEIASVDSLTGKPMIHYFYSIK